jgi:hypothetical protein
MSLETPAAGSREHVKPHGGSSLRRLVFTLMLVLLLVLAIEAGCRIFLALSRQVPPGRPDRVIVSYYPELKAPLLKEIAKDDGWFDVLILGGSVMYDYYGSPGLHLQEKLEENGYGPVRIWNLSRPAHGSRDSLVKYRWLEGRRFDWVIFYHGLNELRYNNVPGPEFRTDYSHVEWYAELNRVAQYPGLKRASAIPAVAGILRTALKKRYGGGFRLHHGEVPPDELAQFGREIRTTASLEKNLRELASLAGGRNEYLSVATYASCMLEPYSDEQMETDRDHLIRGRLDLRIQDYAVPAYADFAMPARIWGDLEHVTRGIAAHNQLIRELAEEGILEMIDVAAAISCEGANFIDFCHLAPAGVDLMVGAILTSAPESYRSLEDSGRRGWEDDDSIGHIQGIL